MEKNTKKILSVAFCLLSLFLFLLQAVPVSASNPWSNGLNLARNNSGLPENQAEDVIFTFLNWLLLIFTFISVIAFIIAGIMFLTAGGNTQQADSARNYVKYAIIGIAVGLSGYTIISFVASTMAGTVQTQTLLQPFNRFLV